MKIWDTDVNLVHLGRVRRVDPQIYVAKMREVGYGAAFRYLRRSPNDTTLVTREEIELYHANGVRVGFIFQHKSNEPELFTDENGNLDGRAAAARATELGIPHGKPIFFAFDTDIMQTHKNFVTAYLTAVAHHVKPNWLVMVYGDSEVINYATSTPHPDPGMGDLADGGMLTNAKGWSGDKRIFQSDNPKVLVRQISLPMRPYPDAPFLVDTGEVHDDLVDVVTW